MDKLPSRHRWASKNPRSCWLKCAEFSLGQRELWCSLTAASYRSCLKNLVFFSEVDCPTKGSSVPGRTRCLMPCCTMTLLLVSQQFQSWRRPQLWTSTATEDATGCPILGYRGQNGRGHSRPAASGGGQASASNLPAMNTAPAK